MFEFLKKAMATKNRPEMVTVEDPLIPVILKHMDMLERGLNEVKRDVEVIQRYVTLLQQCNYHVAPAKWNDIKKYLNTITIEEMRSAGVCGRDIKKELT